LKKIPFNKAVINLRLFEGIEGREQIIEEELNCKEKLVRSIGSVRDLRKVQGGSIGSRAQGGFNGFPEHFFSLSYILTEEPLNKPARHQTFPEASRVSSRLVW